MALDIFLQGKLLHCLLVCTQSCLLSLHTPVHGIFRSSLNWLFSSALSEAYRKYLSLIRLLGVHMALYRVCWQSGQKRGRGPLQYHRCHPSGSSLLLSSFFFFLYHHLKGREQLFFFLFLLVISFFETLMMSSLAIHQPPQCLWTVAEKAAVT